MHVWHLCNLILHHQPSHHFYNGRRRTGNCSDWRGWISGYSRQQLPVVNGYLQVLKQLRDDFRQQGDAPGWRLSFCGSAQSNRRCNGNTQASATVRQSPSRPSSLFTCNVGSAASIKLLSLVNGETIASLFIPSDGPSVVMLHLGFHDFLSPSGNATPPNTVISPQLWPPVQAPHRRLVSVQVKMKLLFTFVKSAKFFNLITCSITHLSLFVLPRVITFKQAGATRQT